jgi:hypothetical protein
MSSGKQISSLLLWLTAFSLYTLAQEDSGWRISPEKINIQMGSDREVQVLDDSAQELHGAVWSVNDPDLADLQPGDDGRAVIHAKAVGMVIVTARIGDEMRTREIKVWSALRSLPPGTTNYGLHPIGREIGDLPAVPGDGPHIYSLEQTPGGETYLRADREDGIQLWTWHMPEKTQDVDLVCGDWMGGALISAKRADSFTLYTVDKDGETRWQHSFPGVRKSHAYNLQHLIHIVSQSIDGNSATLTGLDEVTGDVLFEMPIPGSYEHLKNIKRDGPSLICASGTTTVPQRTFVSRVIVNMDGLGYIAFSQNEWSLDGGECKPGTVLDPHTLTLSRDEKVLQWQVHTNGTYVSSVVESTSVKQPLSVPMSVATPGPSLSPDDNNGTLVPLNLAHYSLLENDSTPADEFVYRVNQDGELVFRSPMPKYSGPSKDGIVINHDDIAFTTRGSLLIAFRVLDGKEVSRWDAGVEGIEVFAALANGGCLVQTPTDLIEVDSSTKSKVILHGKGMLDWQGRLYRKHN